MPRTVLKVLFLACAVGVNLLGGGGAGGALAASTDFSQAAPQTVTIEAENGIAWYRADKRFVATGQARAVRGLLTVEGQRLVAFYQDTAQAASDTLSSSKSISRLEAHGAARITRHDQRAQAETALYDVTSGLLILKAHNTRATLTTPAASLVARDTITYDTRTLKATAVGDVIIRRLQQDVKADRVVAYMATVGGKTTLKTAEALGHVHIETDREKATAQKAYYDAVQGEVVTLVGNVVLLRDGHRLTGDKAIFDLKSGVSRLVGKEGGRRIHAIIGSTDTHLPPHTQE